jgi:hypothetical protein
LSELKDTRLRLKVKTEKRIVQTAIARLKASGHDIDRDVFMEFLDEFYQYLENERWEFRKPDPVTAEWIRDIAETLIDFYSTWHRAESEGGRQFLRDHPPRDDDGEWNAYRLAIATSIDRGLLSYDERTGLLRRIGPH